MKILKNMKSFGKLKTLRSCDPRPLLFIVGGGGFTNPQGGLIKKRNTPGLVGCLHGTNNQTTQHSWAGWMSAWQD